MRPNFCLSLLGRLRFDLGTTESFASAPSPGPWTTRQRRWDQIPPERTNPGNFYVAELNLQKLPRRKEMKYPRRFRQEFFIEQPALGGNLRPREALRRGARLPL